MILGAGKELWGFGVWEERSRAGFMIYAYVGWMLDAWGEGAAFSPHACREVWGAAGFCEVKWPRGFEGVWASCLARRGEGRRGMEQRERDRFPAGADGRFCVHEGDCLDVDDVWTSRAGGEGTQHYILECVLGGGGHGRRKKSVSPGLGGGRGAQPSDVRREVRLTHAGGVRKWSHDAGLGWRREKRGGGAV